MSPAIEAAYLPLKGSVFVFLESRGAAFVVAPGIAATNAHNSGIVDEKSVIGVSADYDLMFFRAAGRKAPPIAAPRVGEEVLAYGQGGDGDLRVARGVVRGLDVPIPRDCAGCKPQSAFAFEADAGKGFSGGPVVDAKTGALVGIVFGFRKSDEARENRVIYAYDMAHVLGELEKIGVRNARID